MNNSSPLPGILLVAAIIGGWYVHEHPSVADDWRWPFSLMSTSEVRAAYDHERADTATALKAAQQQVLADKITNSRQLADFLTAAKKEARHRGFAAYEERHAKELGPNWDKTKVAAVLGEMSAEHSK